MFYISHIQGSLARAMCADDIRHIAYTGVYFLIPMKHEAAVIVPLKPQSRDHPQIRRTLCHDFDHGIPRLDGDLCQHGTTARDHKNRGKSHHLRERMH